MKEGGPWLYPMRQEFIHQTLEFPGFGGVGGGPRFDLTLMVEALALPGAEHKNSLNEAKADRLELRPSASQQPP